MFMMIMMMMMMMTTTMDMSPTRRHARHDIVVSSCDVSDGSSGNSAYDDNDNVVPCFYYYYYYYSCDTITQKCCRGTVHKSLSQVRHWSNVSYTAAAAAQLGLCSVVLKRCNEQQRLQIAPECQI